ncbi:hypothetical protein [Virgibacillus salexigens]|nr:hypothetical protein [Virgibacillus massiliensis]MYL43995.1 hypothetical protein [Virgibacillus massiliensis]
MMEQVVILITSVINLTISITNLIAVLLSRRKKKKNPYLKRRRRRKK